MTLATKYNGETSKKLGKYKIETSTYEYGAGSSYHYFKVCVLLYKNGELCNKRSYLSKVHYKSNGKWHWTKYKGYFSEWSYNQHWFFYEYYPGLKVDKIKIKFKK